MASMGDFSENAGYQMAKAKLRGINNRVNEIEDLLRRAQIIENRGASDEVRVGSSLELEVNGKVKNYQILGSAESDPARGIISHVSPLGKALLGHHEKEIVLLELPERTVQYKIIKIF
jgi:transcription elongation factor GreA